MPVNYPQVGYVDSSGMGRLLGAAAKADRRGSSKAGTRLGLGASPRHSPTGRGGYRGMARVGGHRVMASGTPQRAEGRKDPWEHWGSWQWSEGTRGRWKSLPHSWGHSWEWHTLVCVCESASSLGMLLPTQGHREARSRLMARPTLYEELKAAGSAQGS